MFDENESASQRMEELASGSAPIQGRMTQATVLVLELMRKRQTLPPPPPAGDVAGRFTLLNFMATHVRACNGRVVQLERDGLVACFTGDRAADDAYEATVAILKGARELHDGQDQHPAVRAALDEGLIHFLSYGDGVPLDPQGPVIDRCRLLAGVAPSGGVLASGAYHRAGSRRDDWKPVPKIPFEGLEEMRMFQLKQYGEPFEWSPVLLLEARKYDALRDRIDDLTYLLQQKDAQVGRLEEIVDEASVDIAPDAGSVGHILGDAQAAELRRRFGDLQRLQLAALLPLISNGSPDLGALVASLTTLAELVASLRKRHPDAPWSDVDFWVSLLRLPTSERGAGER